MLSFLDILILTLIYHLTFLLHLLGFFGWIFQSNRIFCRYYLLLCFMYILWFTIWVTDWLILILLKQIFVLYILFRFDVTWFLSIYLMYKTWLWFVCLTRKSFLSIIFFLNYFLLLLLRYRVYLILWYYSFFQLKLWFSLTVLIYFNRFCWVFFLLRFLKFIGLDGLCLK